VRTPWVLDQQIRQLGDLGGEPRLGARLEHPAAGAEHRAGQAAELEPVSIAATTSPKLLPSIDALMPASTAPIAAPVAPPEIAR